jgi:hypothetical protein
VCGVWGVGCGCGVSVSSYLLHLTPLCAHHTALLQQVQELPGGQAVTLPTHVPQQFPHSASGTTPAGLQVRVQTQRARSVRGPATAVRVRAACRRHSGGGGKRWGGGATTYLAGGGGDRVVREDTPQLTCARGARRNNIINFSATTLATRTAGSYTTTATHTTRSTPTRTQQHNSPPALTPHTRTAPS